MIDQDSDSDSKVKPITKISIRQIRVYFVSSKCPLTCNTVLLVPYTSTIARSDKNRRKYVIEIEY